MQSIRFDYFTVLMRQIACIIMYHLRCSLCQKMINSEHDPTANILQRHWSSGETAMQSANVLTHWHTALQPHLNFLCMPGQDCGRTCILNKYMSLHLHTSRVMLEEDDSHLQQHIIIWSLQIARRSFPFARLKCSVQVHGWADSWQDGACMTSPDAHDLLASRTMYTRIWAV